MDYYAEQSAIFSGEQVSKKLTSTADRVGVHKAIFDNLIFLGDTFSDAWTITIYTSKSDPNNRSNPNTFLGVCSFTFCKYFFVWRIQDDLGCTDKRAIWRHKDR